jgi:hypothetical protein
MPRHAPPPQAAALAYLRDAGATVELLAQGKVVLGYVVLGPVGLLLIAELVRVSATLPGGHEVKTVAQSKWHRIPLQVGPEASGSSKQQAASSCSGDGSSSSRSWGARAGGWQAAGGRNAPMLTPPPLYRPAPATRAGPDHPGGHQGGV